MSNLLSAICLLTIVSSSLALEVTPGSTCAEVCLDRADADANDPSSSSTDTSDITCKNSEYLSTGVGSKYKGCLDCLMGSDNVDEATGETDVAWFLYNLRYTVDVCLYGFGNTTKVSSPCDIDTACLPLKKALLDGDLAPNSTSQYDFCDADGGAFEASSVNACAACLKADSTQSYLSNFLIGLEAGCEQRPEAGVVLGLEGDLFSSAGVNITEPITKDDKDDGTGMTVGTIVGIAVGAALLFLGGTALFIVYYRRQKGHVKNHDNEKRAPGTMPAVSPAFQGDHKKSSSFHSDIELTHSAPDVNTHAHSGSFSSNTDFYDKLEEVMSSTRKKKFNFDPHADSLNPSTALPTHPAYIPNTMSRANTPSPVPPASAPMGAPQRPSPPRQVLASDATTRTISPPPAARAASRSRTRSPPPAQSAAYSSVHQTLSSPPTIQDHRSSTGSGSTTATLVSGIGSKRANRPAPLQNVGGDQKPSSWTLQKYLLNSDDTPIPIPPPPPMTGRSVLSQQSQQSQTSARSNFSAGNAPVGTMTSQGQGTSGASLATSPPLPPPPPGPGPPNTKTSSKDAKAGKKDQGTNGSSEAKGKTTSPRRIPHLGLPSVPRIKVPKKYPPPNIVIQDATPIEGHDISGPMDPRTMAAAPPRFPDSSIGHNNGQHGQAVYVSRCTGPQGSPGSVSSGPIQQEHVMLGSDGQVIETRVPMPSWQKFESEEVQTGRSAALYG